MNTIGERIKHLRKRKDITQKELSDATKINRGNLSNYEKNKVLPAANTIISLSNYFEVSCDWLLKGYEHEPVRYTDTLDQSYSNRLKVISSNETNLILNFRKLPLTKQMRFIGRVEEAAELYATDLKPEAQPELKPPLNPDCTDRKENIENV